MIVKGKKTYVEHLDVIIDPLDVISKIEDISVPKGLAYLGDDGFWYKKYGFDYHRREDLYEKDRLATEEEILLQQSFNVVRNFIIANREKL
jgi:hypothetical protein